MKHALPKAILGSTGLMCAGIPWVVLCAAFPAGVGLAVPAPARAYNTLAEVEGSPTPIVWAEPPTIGLDLSGLTEAQANLLTSELSAAIETWNAVDCAGDLAAFVGPAAHEADVIVRIAPDWTGYDPTAAGSTDLVMASTMDGGAEIVSATLALNGTMEWAAYPQEGTSGPRDMRAVLTHELGHVLGLEHSDDPNATMAAAYAGAPQADLGEDDIAGICSLYAPPPPPECIQDAECPTGHWCVEGECHPDVRYGTECTDGSDCFGNRCVEVEGGGACTYVCETDADCPSQTSCLSAMGRDERVCAPSSPTSGCSIAAGGRPMPLLFIAILSLALVTFTRRARSKTRALRWMAVLAIALGGCSGEVGDDDAGNAMADAGEHDSGVVPDSGPPDDARTEPDAGAVPDCEPGEMRIGPCGFCGSQGQRCGDDRRWMGTSACLGEGECAVGTVETRVEMCAQEQRLCLDGCMWGDWEALEPAGACMPGATRVSGDSCGPDETRDEVCNDACAWEPASACVGPCGVVPRTTPDWASEVCIPAGLFYRGTDHISSAYANAKPLAEVYLSAYLIDAYPVTIRRYAQCVSAGVCTASTHPGYSLPERIDYPVQYLTRFQAEQFCMWDGGRRLPTEAQWEKAARGPSPRLNDFPWEGTTWDCSLVPSIPCGYPAPPAGQENWATHPYDGLPGSRSYYGVYLQVPGVGEIVADYYGGGFYYDPRSLSDPEYMDGTTLGAGRGCTVVSGCTVFQRWYYSVNNSSGNPAPVDAGFRCARRAP